MLTSLLSSCPSLLVSQAVSDIGVAVIHGGVSTFLAVVLLSLSASYVFRVSDKRLISPYRKLRTSIASAVVEQQLCGAHEVSLGLPRLSS